MKKIKCEACSGEGYKFRYSDEAQYHGYSEDYIECDECLGRGHFEYLNPNDILKNILNDDTTSSL